MTFPSYILFICKNEAMDDIQLTQTVLDGLNYPQSTETNKQYLANIGGLIGLVKLIGLDCDRGLTSLQVPQLRDKFGCNAFPESPLHSYLNLLVKALSDTTLIILIAAATVSLIIGVLTEDNGWIQGVAIFVCVILISNISATNDYTKQLQFRSLEVSASNAERCSVIRDGYISRINPVDLVVGDIVVLQVSF